MWIKLEEGKTLLLKKIEFSKNRTYLESKFCDNSKIAFRIIFNEYYVNFNRQSRNLQTYYNDCKNIITTDESNEVIVGGVAAGKQSPPCHF